MEKENERPLEAINMDNLDIEKAMKLLEDAIKNKKPEKLKGKVIFMRNIPFVVSEDTYAKYLQVEVMWLNPKLAEDAIKALNLQPKTLKDALLIKEARRTIMYA